MTGSILIPGIGSFKIPSGLSLPSPGGEGETGLGSLTVTPQGISGSIVLHSGNNLFFDSSIFKLGGTLSMAFDTADFESSGAAGGKFSVAAGTLVIPDIVNLQDADFSFSFDDDGQFRFEVAGSVWSVFPTTTGEQTVATASGQLEVDLLENGFPAFELLDLGIAGLSAERAQQKVGDVFKIETVLQHASEPRLTFLLRQVRRCKVLNGTGSQPGYERIRAFARHHRLDWP